MPEQSLFPEIGIMQEIAHLYHDELRPLFRDRALPRKTRARLARKYVEIKCDAESYRKYGCGDLAEILTRLHNLQNEIAAERR